MKITIEVDDAILAKAMDITCAKTEEEAVHTSLDVLSGEKSHREEAHPYKPINLEAPPGPAAAPASATA